LKQVLISVGLLLVSSLASANLVPNSVSPAPHQSSSVAIALKGFSGQTLGHLADLPLANQKLTKIETLYSNLFEYSSHIHHAIDQDGLAVFWKNALISTAIDAANSQKNWAKAHVSTDNNHDILQFVANSFNDDYVNGTDNIDTHINEVPLPAAIWLFSSALMLFGFARRSSI
jgi:hypothetical protein